MKNNIPDYQTIMLPLLQLLKDGKPFALNDVTQTLAGKFKLSEDDLRIKVPSGQQHLFRNRVTWAISYLKSAGMISYPQRGVYAITEIGRDVLKENIDRIDTNYLKKFEAYRRWQNTFSETSQISSESESLLANKTPDEFIGDMIKAVNDKISIELLEILKTKPASVFEEFVLKLLDKMGYGGTENSNFEVVGKSGDNGIDGIIYQDQLGIDRVYVQAKRWSENKVQSSHVRDFIGALSLKGTNKGIFITTSSYTADACKTAQMNPHNRIILIDGQELTKYALRYNVGVQVKAEYEVKAIDNNFFEGV